MSMPVTLRRPPGTQETGSTESARRDRRPWRRALRRDWQLYTLAILPVLFFLIFRYVPMFGVVIAFRRFEPGGSIFGEHWVGWHYVQLFLSDPTFWSVFINTLALGALTVVVLFPLPIVLALLLNEVSNGLLKRLVQSISYLPHFLSIVVVAAIIMQFLSVDGAMNQVLRTFSRQPIPFLQQPEWFRQIYVGSEVWQTLGWGTILYLAALTTIDPNLYEAARIDGAGRLRQTWHVTLPSIRPTIMTLLILNIGTFTAVGFEKILLIYNPLTYPTGDVITTYLYRMGVVSNNFSYAAAIGLFEGVIGLILITAANLISRRTVGASLW